MAILGIVWFIGGFTTLIDLRFTFSRERREYKLYSHGMKSFERHDKFRRLEMAHSGHFEPHPYRNITPRKSTIATLFFFQQESVI